MSETGLLPCPFCGGEPEAKILLVSQDGREWRLVIATCTACTARVEKRLPPSFAQGSLWKNADTYEVSSAVIAEIRERWNKRTP